MLVLTHPLSFAWLASRLLQPSQTLPMEAQPGRRSQDLPPLLLTEARLPFLRWVTVWFGLVQPAFRGLLSRRVAELSPEYQDFLEALSSLPIN